jgi:uncharacterized protein
VANILRDNNFPRVSVILATLLAFCTLGAIIGGMLGVGLGKIQGIDIQSVMDKLTVESPENERNFVRTFLGLNHFFMFLVPAFLTVWFFYKKATSDYLKLNKIPSIWMVILGVLFIVASLPAVQYSMWLNQQIPLPDWAKMMEDSTADSIKSLLVMNRPIELFLNILVIGLLPAIGEELVFRGVLQQQLMRRIANPHLAIWLAGAIFSAIHFQFEGFLPRMLLGAGLGYLFYLTNNIWIPIIAHFINNAGQVIAQYLMPEKMNSLELEKDIQIPIWAAAVSVLATFFIGRKIWEMVQSNLPKPTVVLRDENKISLDDFR